MAAITVLFAGLAVVGLVPMPLVVLPFVLSSVARRLSLVASEATIDGEGLWLGETLAAKRTDVLDAWFDPEDDEHRVTVAAAPDRMFVLHMANEEQGRRFARALAPRGAAAHRVAGVRPGIEPALLPIRLLAVVVASLVTTSSPAALLLLGFVGLGAFGLVVGRQLDAGPDALAIRSLFGTRRIAYADLARVDLDEGVVELAAGGRIAVPPRVVRDPLLAAAPWTRRAHARALAFAAAKAGTPRAD